MRRFVIAAAGSLAVTLFAAVSSGGARSGATAGPRPFLVFDGLLYLGKPDSGTLGMTPIHGVNPPAALQHPADGVDEAQVRASLQSQQGYSGAVYLDYEVWPTFHASPPEISASIAKLNGVLRIAHEIAPAAKIGYYSVIPCHDYWGLVKNDTAMMRQWEDCNAQMDELAAHVDIVMPSLYTYYNDPHGWDVFADALLKAARRYHKPVYAFLWPEFHVSNQFLKGKNLPGNFWRHELEFCRTRADGVVLWGGWQEPWDEGAQWWQETKEFLAALNPK